MIIFFMKNIFGLILLCLILNSCATTQDVLHKDSIRKGASKLEVRRAFLNAGISNDPWVSACFREYFSDTKMEIIASADRDVWLVFKNVSWPHTACSQSKMGDGVLEAWVPTYDEAKKIASGNKSNKKIVKKKKPKKQVPKIVTGDTEIVPAASGSGFYITSSGYILTNNHVIEGCRKVSLTHNGKEVEANVISTDAKNDLAILKSNVRPNRFYKISNEDPKLLENVIIAGYPLGKRVSSAIKTSKGSITSLAGYGDNYSNFQTDAALNQGNSGGPIMNNGGNVVGVAVANFGKGAGVESFNFGIKSSTVKSFVSSNDINFTIGSKAKLNNEQLSNLITNATIYLECWLTVADIKAIIAQEENKKAFYSEYQ